MVCKLLLLALALGNATAAQTPGIISPPSRAPLPLNNPLQDKNFYLLSLMQQTPSVRDALLRSPALTKLTSDRFALQANLATLLDQPAATYIQYFLWTDAQIQASADALRALYRSDADMRALVSGPLRHSGTSVLFGAKSDEEMLVGTWITEVQSINGILQTYGLGKAPLYPKIDSISYDPNSEYYRGVLHQTAWTVSTTDGDHSLFFEPSLHFALYLLQLNRRDEAARFEPMEAGENAAALALIPKIDWSRYPYSVILIPGMGPEVPGVAISPMGLLHVIAAAKKYSDGAAPFILVSGGFVHPSQTQFSEAMEMKKSLMRDYGIPDSAIIVDPHARHTTTNFRNAAREIYRYKIPFDKPALVTGDIYQTLYIENANFPKRCLRELGYKCFIELHQVSPVDLEWLPNIQSLQQNPNDPLDP